jgi:tRNA pseudouridine38-40 synthase
LAPSSDDVVQAPPTKLHGVCLVVAYDGTDFHGFQRQPGQRTVQGELERAASEMAGHPVSIRGAGRTDAGVHALGQVVAFDSARLISERGWMLGLNTKLPDDIRVQRARACAPDYHPRFDAVGKRYRYLLQLGEAKNPLLRHRAWQLGKWRLDVARMREAAQALIGTHDFRAFRASDDERENTVRTLWAIEITEHFAGDPSLVALDFHGNAFMKNMVRILTGTLVEVGIGRLPVQAMSGLLGPQAQRSEAGQTAPPQGLTLVEVELGRSAGHAPPADATLG